MSILLVRQKEDVDSAIINKGPYRLVPEFISFEIEPSRWFKISVAQRESHLRNFHEAKIITEGHGENPSSSNAISQPDKQSSTKD